VNWDAIGAIAEMVGALGVIVTLVFFLRQLRQMSNQASNTNAWSVSQALSETNNIIASDPHLAAIWLKGRTGLEALSDSEALRFRMLAWSRINTLIYIFEHKPKSHFRAAIDQAARGIASSEGFRQVCNEAKQAMPAALFNRLTGGA